MKSTTTPSVKPAGELADIDSYCVTSLQTIEVGERIRAWIKARETEGWTVDFQIKQSNGQTGVMWQCHKKMNDRNYQEFTPCISMTGKEFLMN